VNSFTEPFLTKLSSLLRVPSVTSNSSALAVFVSIALAATALFVVYLIVCVVRERIEDLKLRRRQQQCRLSYASNWRMEGLPILGSRNGQTDATDQDQAAMRPSNITPFVLHPQAEEDAPLPKRVAA
jgi:hypothetical protein